MGGGGDRRGTGHRAGHEWAIFLPVLPSAVGWFTFVYRETTLGGRVMALVAFLAAGAAAMVLASLPLVRGSAR